MQLNIARLEDRLLVISSAIGAPVYDFDFDLNFSCTHPYEFRGSELCVLRIGAVREYEAEYAEKADWGLRLVNSPEEHFRASELEGWYPLIPDLTPTTRIFQSLPSASEIESEFEWPVFVKGSRQTSKHNPDLSIARDPGDYSRLCNGYRCDEILNWQRPVIRQFVQLEPIAGDVPNKIRPSREFRTFWWNGELVGCGHYWYQLPAYGAADLEAGISVAREAARRVSVPFLVVDIARTTSGDWIVIECNDAQEAGYVGLPPTVLWQNILERV